MTAAAQNKGLLAVERLLARIDMATSHIVVDFHGDVHFDAAQSVNHGLEAVEVDFRIMVDGNARQLGNSIDSA